MRNRSYLLKRCHFKSSNQMSEYFRMDFLSKNTRKRYTFYIYIQILFMPPKRQLPSQDNPATTNDRLQNEMNMMLQQDVHSSQFQQMDPEDYIDEGENQQEDDERDNKKFNPIKFIENGYQPVWRWIRMNIRHMKLKLSKVLQERLRREGSRKSFIYLYEQCKKNKGLKEHIKKLFDGNYFGRMFEMSKIPNKDEARNCMRFVVLKLKESFEKNRKPWLKKKQGNWNDD